MNKNLISGLIVILLLGFSYVGQDAFASFEPPLELKTYTVDEDGAPKNTFTFNETPYLYMDLPLEEGKSSVSAYWHSPSGIDYYADEHPNSLTERWLSLTNWNNIKEVGTWSINSNVFYSTGTSYTSSASYSVTPEPLSIILFLIGGMPLAFNLIRKKRQVLKV